VPPGYVRKKPPVKPKLDPFIAVIDSILHVGFGRRPAVQPGVEVDKRQILTLLGREIYCRMPHAGPSNSAVGPCLSARRHG
jgi:hypothetical protein